MEGESSASFTLECKHGGAGALPCGDEAALAMYPGVVASLDSSSLFLFELL